MVQDTMVISVVVFQVGHERLNQPRSAWLGRANCNRLYEKRTILMIPGEAYCVATTGAAWQSYMRIATLFGGQMHASSILSGCCGFAPRSIRGNASR